MERGISFSRFGAAKRTGGGEGGVAAALDPRRDRHWASERTNHPFPLFRSEEEGKGGKVIYLVKFSERHLRRRKRVRLGFLFLYLLLLLLQLGGRR